MYISHSLKLYRSIVGGHFVDVKIGRNEKNKCSENLKLKSGSVMCATSLGIRMFVYWGKIA